MSKVAIQLVHMHAHLKRFAELVGFEIVDVVLSTVCMSGQALPCMQIPVHSTAAGTAVPMRSSWAAQRADRPLYRWGETGTWTAGVVTVGLVFFKKKKDEQD